MPEQMSARLKQADTDADGFVSRAEMVMVSRLRGRSGGQQKDRQATPDYESEDSNGNRPGGDVRVAQRWSKATTRRLQFSCSNNARVKFPKYICQHHWTDHSLRLRSVASLMLSGNVLNAPSLRIGRGLVVTFTVESMDVCVAPWSSGFGNLGCFESDPVGGSNSGVRSDS